MFPLNTVEVTVVIRNMKVCQKRNYPYSNVFYLKSQGWRWFKTDDLQKTNFNLQTIICHSFSSF